MPLDDVVILDVDKNEMELPFNDVDDLPSEAVSKYFVVNANKHLGLLANVYHWGLLCILITLV